MAKHSERASRAAGVKRQRVPPPITEGGERYEGEDVLAEFPGDIGVVLWKSYQNVTLWAEAGPEERQSLFTAGADRRRREDLRGLAAETEILVPLGGIADLLGEPSSLAPPAIGDSCRRISTWAEMRGAIGTALLFAQAAALAQPSDAAAACAVGKLARQRSEYGRAETWYRHAIVVARRSNERDGYVRALIGLGKVHWQRGALPSARRAFLHALRSSRRYRLQEYEGWALQDLAGLAIHAGRWNEPVRYLRAARETFGPGNPLIPRMINDVAYAWASAGFFRAALSVLRALVEYPFPAPDQLRLWGSVARAAGGAGDEEVFRAASEEIERLAEDPATTEAVASVLLDFARGAASIGQWDIAEATGRRALSLADQRGESRVRMAAEPFIESLAAERIAARPLIGAVDEPETIEPLSAELVGFVRESAAAAR